MQRAHAACKPHKCSHALGLLGMPSALQAASSGFVLFV